MPTVAQIEAEDAITAIRASRLIGAVRASAIYQESAALYADVADLVNALVDVTTPAADVIKSQQLSAIVTALDDLGDGTVGVKGGKFGADYSQTRDREALIAEVLGLLYEAALFGATADGSTGFYIATQMAEVYGCRACSCWPCSCGSLRC